MADLDTVEISSLYRVNSHTTSARHPLIRSVYAVIVLPIKISKEQSPDGLVKRARLLSKYSRE